MKKESSDWSGGAQAKQMAQIIENGLGNPVSRKILKFLAKREEGEERRAEKFLNHMQIWT